MYCRNCGTLLTDDAKFCASCGTSTAANKPQQSNSEEQAWISMPHTSLDGFANKIQNLANNSSIPAKIHMTGANLLLVVNGIIMVIMAIILAYAIISGCGDVLEVINLYNDEVAIIGSILLIVFGICYIYTAAMPAIFTVINILAPKKRNSGCSLASMHYIYRLRLHHVGRIRDFQRAVSDGRFFIWHFVFLFWCLRSTSGKDTDSRVVSFALHISSILFFRSTFNK